jgi:hypothetical protein
VSGVHRAWDDVAGKYCTKHKRPCNCRIHPGPCPFKVGDHVVGTVFSDIRGVVAKRQWQTLQNGWGALKGKIQVRWWISVHGDGAGWGAPANELKFDVLDALARV